MKMNRRRNKWVSRCAVLISLQLSACKDQDFKEIRNGDVCIQLTRMNGADQGDGNRFKFRLLPSKAFASMHPLSTDNFWYHMDSCFYTEKNGVRIYVPVIQPVANGVKNDFEYLLEFYPAVAAQNDSVRLVYDDKYITRQLYTFKIKL